MTPAGVIWCRRLLGRKAALFEGMVLEACAGDHESDEFGAASDERYQAFFTMRVFTWPTFLALFSFLVPDFFTAFFVAISNSLFCV
jgi:hypothetical protein